MFNTIGLPAGILKFGLLLATCLPHDISCTRQSTGYGASSHVIMATIHAAARDLNSQYVQIIQ